MKKTLEIKVIDRRTKKEEVEEIYGKKFLEFLYGENFKNSKIFLNFFSKFSFFSKFYGFLQKRRFSKRKILPFVKKYNINTEEFEKRLEEFSSFNDFFIRKLKKNSRKIVSDPNVCILPADARYLVFKDIEREKGFYVKGKKFDLEKFLRDKKLAKKYEKGSMAIARLCPLDYHRFHFPDFCKVKESKLINGFLYSVNPIALKKNIEIFCENKRVLTILETKNFKDILFVEVGATNVGSIVQTYREKSFYEKGEEKGYFSFGGSSIVMLFEENTIKFDEDLLKNSENKIETKAYFGESLGKKLF